MSGYDLFPIKMKDLDANRVYGSKVANERKLGRTKTLNNKERIQKDLDKLRRQNGCNIVKFNIKIILCTKGKKQKSIKMWEI